MGRFLRVFEDWKSIISPTPKVQILTTSNLDKYALCASLCLPFLNNDRKSGMIVNFTQTFTFLVLKWEGSSGSLKIGKIISPTPKVQILTTSNLDKYYVNFFFLNSDRKLTLDCKFYSNFHFFSPQMGRFLRVFEDWKDYFPHTESANFDNF